MPASKILMGVPAYGYISSSTATTLIHKRSESSSKGISNRERASLVHEEQLEARAEEIKSPFHRAYERGMREAEQKRERRAAADELKKRASIIACPNDHSGKPCAGITDQNITDIAWNPLNPTAVNNGTTNSTAPGVFNLGTGVGKTKLGKGDLSGLEGNQIDFWKLINYGVIVKEGVDFVGANGYTRAWDSCSSTVSLRLLRFFSVATSSS
jgi:hypothetical protein